MASQIAGYPTSGLERFFDAVNEGAESTMKILSKVQEYDTNRDVNRKLKEAADKASKIKSGDDGVTTSREGAYGTGDGTTGSGGGGEQISIPTVGDPSQTGEGHVASKSERLSYYQQKAKELGLNFDAIVHTVSLEGLNKYTGDNGKSFGDFQLYTGGGMGNEAVKAGIKISDPSTWKQQADFALAQMAAHKGDAKWFAGQWHGPRDRSPWAVANFGNPDARPAGGSSYTTTPRPVAPGTPDAPAATPTQTTELPPEFDYNPGRAQRDFGAPAPALAPSPPPEPLTPGRADPSTTMAAPSTQPVSGVMRSYRPPTPAPAPGPGAALGGPPPEMREQALAQLAQRQANPQGTQSPINDLIAQHGGFYIPPQRQALSPSRGGSDLYNSGLA